MLWTYRSFCAEVAVEEPEMPEDRVEHTSNVRARTAQSPSECSFGEDVDGDMLVGWATGPTSAVVHWVPSADFHT